MSPPPARVVLAFLAPLPAGVLRALLGADPRVRVLGEAPDVDSLRALLRRGGADAVVVGAPAGALPPEVLRLLAEFPRLTVVALGAGEKSATVAALRLHLETLDDPGPGALVDAVRAAALARAWFPLGEGADMDRSPPGPDRAVHSAAGRAAGPFPSNALPAAAPASALPAPSAAPMPTAATVAFNQAVKRMLNSVATQLLPPPPGGGVPDPSASVVSVRERGVGVGNYVGHETRAGFVPDEVFGGRVEAGVRLELWAATAGGLGPLTLGVQERLRTRRDLLRQRGFLKLRLADTSLAEAPAGSDWRQTLLLEALFEYQYRDAREAESLIARIPVEMDDPPGAMVVTGRLARWDELGAPALSIRGPARVGALGLLLFVPAGSALAGSVTVRRTFDGAAGPTDAFTLAQDFADAAGGEAPASRDAELTYVDLAALVVDSQPVDAPLKMGDWDQDSAPDPYEAHVLALDPAVRLESSADRLEVAYQHPALEDPAVVYLRAMPGPEM
jgi:hypothetical protein